MPTPEQLTIPDKLDSLNVTKQAIREAIVSKGVEVPEGTTFYEYANLIGEISVGTPAEYVNVTFTASGGNSYGAIFETEDGFNQVESGVYNQTDTVKVRKGSNIYMWCPDVSTLTSAFEVTNGTAASFSSQTENDASEVRVVIPFSDCSIDAYYKQTGGGSDGS